MQRLGKNNGSYQGECIDIHAITRQIEEVAVAKGWEPDPIVVSPAQQLAAFRRSSASPRARVYISSGIHGDEPAGPLAVLKLFQETQWPQSISGWIIPCLNPAGYIRNCRENEDGIDLNRDYRSPKTALVRAHLAWLERQPRFDVSLLLHEDWESNGFYLYELNPSQAPSLSQAMVAKVSEVCPIDTSPVIEGRAAQQGIICANPDLLKRPDWPEAFYLVHNKAPSSYTLEAPSDFPLAVRVNALVAGVNAALESLEKAPATFR